MSGLYEYGETFFNSIGGGSARSADVLVPMVLASLKAGSVIDVGCGRGVWLRRFGAAGIGDLLGVDGDYVTAEALVVPPKDFRALDITKPFALGRTYDLGVCLEVGEHVAPETSAVLVDNLARHAPMILFSAAVPGQGGENHINEKPLEFWRGLFRAQGYVALDPYRAKMAGRADVEPWYRYNVLLYVRETLVPGLSAELRAAVIPAGERVRDVSSPVFKLRKAVLSRLPRGAVTALARTKHRLRNMTLAHP